MSWRIKKRKEGNLTHKNRQELIRMCSRITQITEHVTSRPDCLAVFETCMCHLVSHLDRPTRDNLFATVNMVVDADHEATKRSLATKKMFRSLKKSQSTIGAGLVTKKMIDTLIVDTEKSGLNQSVRDDIFKAVIMRLAMELSHNEVNQVINHLLPNIKAKKEQEQNRFMYG